MAGQAAVTIHRNFKRVEPDLIHRLSGFPTGYFADIQGRRGGLDTGIKPMFRAAPVIGTADDGADDGADAAEQDGRVRNGAGGVECSHLTCSLDLAVCAVVLF